MPALARGVIPGQPPAKGIKFPQGLDHPASRETFGPKLQSTFGALGRRGVGAPQRVEPQQQKHGAPVARSFLGELGHQAETTFQSLYPRPSKQGTVPVSQSNAPGLAMARPIASGQIIKGLGHAAENLPSSTVNTIAGAVPALYGTAKAGVEAAKGHPKELGEIGKGLLHTVEHPWTSFQQNPAGTALMFAAPEAGVGRLAGAAMRSGGLGEKAAQVASTARAPLYVYGRSTGAAGDQIASGLHDVSIPRSYSPNVIRKGAQVAADTFKAKALGHNPNMATAEQANRLLYGGGLLGQHAFRGRLQGVFKPGLVDTQAGTGEMLRRLYTNSASKMMKDIKPKHGAEAVPLAVEGIIRNPKTMMADLQKEHARLQDAATGLTGNDLRQNLINQESIQKLLADEKLHTTPQPVFDAARHYSAEMRPLEERMVQLGHLEPDQLHARNVPYAMAHMPDVSYNHDPGAHPLVGQVAAATHEVHSAQRELKRAIGERKAAEIAHPSAGVTTDIARARTALRQAELGKANAGGRLGSYGLKALGREQRVKDARAAYRAAKEQHVMRHTDRVESAKQRLLDAHANRHELEDRLSHLKLAGAIKNSGEMYPRLEQHGQPLSHSVIEAHMAQHLEDRNVGFLTHKDEPTYGEALHSIASRRPATERRARTGVAFQNGAYDRSFNALKLQAYKNANAVAGHENYDQMLRRFGIGRFNDPKAAEAALKQFLTTAEGKAITTALGKMRVYRIGPERVIKRGNVETRFLGPAAQDFGLTMQKGLNEVADTPTHTLLPERVAQRIDQHDKLNNPGGLEKHLQWYTSKFRGAKLFTSPRWLLGNPQEHAIRLAMASINPFAIFGVGKAVGLGHGLIDNFQHMAVDPSLTEAQRYVARAHVGAYAAGTHYGSLMVNDVHRELVGPNAIEGQRLGKAFDERTGVSQMIAGWQGWRAFVGRGMGRIEQNSKAGMLGKAALSEVPKFSKDWAALISRQDKAVKAYAESKLSPNEAVKLGNDIMEMAGNWTHLTPNVREAVQTITPFGLWWLNSMKFVFRTMPRDHPFKTAALAAMEAGVGTEAQLEKAKSYLAGGVNIKLPLVGNITATPGYYTPAGIATEPAKTAGDQILPQVGGPLFTLGGDQRFTSKELKDAHGKPLGDMHRIYLALQELLEGPTPGASQAIELGRRGGTPEPGSFNPFAIKPGTEKGLSKTAMKILSPLRFTYNKEAATRGRTREIPERLVRERARNIPERKVPER